MPEELTPNRIVECICHTLNLPACGHAEALEPVIQKVVTVLRDERTHAVKAACLQIAEEEAERCRRVGATAAEQIAMTIAMRIRRRQVD